MGELVATIQLDGQRKRWPWWQMQAGDYFDVVGRAEFETDAVRNTLSASASAAAKRTNMKFMQRRMDACRIRVFRIDGHDFGNGQSHVSAYVGSDPLKLISMSNGGVRRLTFGTDAEFDFTMNAINVSLRYAAQRNAEIHKNVRFDVTTNRDAGTIIIKCVEVKDEQGN